MSRDRRQKRRSAKNKQDLEECSQDRTSTPSEEQETEDNLVTAGKTLNQSDSSSSSDSEEGSPKSASTDNSNILPKKL